MSFGGFILGTVMMGLGFLAVYKTDWFESNLGDVGAVFGVDDKPWASWKVFGLALMFLGFLTMFGLFSLFFDLTLGRLFSLGQ